MLVLEIVGLVRSDVSLNERIEYINGYFTSDSYLNLKNAYCIPAIKFATSLIMQINASFKNEY